MISKRTAPFCVIKRLTAQLMFQTRITAQYLSFPVSPVRAKVDLSWKPEEKADGTEPIIIIEDWYKEQTICGEEYVHVCCSQFNQTEPECKSYDVKNLCKVRMVKIQSIIIAPG